MKSYSKLRHIQKVNLLLEERYLNEDDTKSNNLAKRLGEITGLSEDMFKYFDTEKAIDFNSFNSFSNAISTIVKDLDQEKTNKMIYDLTSFSGKFNSDDYRKKVVKFMIDTIQRMFDGFQTMKKNPYLSVDKKVNDILTDKDNDYDYKKESDKYYFRVKKTPKSPGAQKLKSQGKFINWTLAKGNAETNIKKLFNS